LIVISKKFGRGGLVACAWRRGLARGDVGWLSFALRVHRVCCVSRAAGVLFGRCGCDRERRAAGVRACSKLSVLGVHRPADGTDGLCGWGLQHLMLRRARVRWASRNLRVQSRVRVRERAASVRRSGPAKERVLGEVEKAHTSMGGEGGFLIRVT
jgi:hypothetical protein